MKEYRHGICVVLKRASGAECLVCHRVDAPDMTQGWQFPQGGIEDFDDLVGEARRELREEIGTDEIDIIRIGDQWFCYDYPEGPHAKHGMIYRGQCHRWILANLLVPDSAIRFDRHHHVEFDQFKWAKPAEILEQIVNFKREAYLAAFRELKIE